MATAKLNLPSIRSKILGSKVTKYKVFDIASKRVEEEKQVFISELKSHPVSVEISAGPNASNLSGTLGGRGNLFSFIGFNKSEADPIANVFDLIKKIRVLKKVTNTKKGFAATVSVPTLGDFSNITRMPWESGRSWLLDIEKRISGLGYYLSGNFKKSRSGTGIQADGVVSNAQFRPVKYFKTMYNTFIRNIKNESRIS